MIKFGKAALSFLLAGALSLSLFGCATNGSAEKETSQAGSEAVGADSQSADVQSADSQSADSQRADSQSADSQSTDVQSADSQSADSQSADSQSADSQNEQLPEPTITESASYNGTVTLKYGVSGYEWGPAVDTLVLGLDGNVSSVSADQFTVTGMTSGNSPSAITVTDAYLSDEYGNKTEEVGPYVAIRLQARYNSLSPFSYNFNTGKNSWVNSVTFNVALAQGHSLTVEYSATEHTRYASLTAGGAMDASKRIAPTDRLKLNVGSHTEGNVKLNYAAYETEAMKEDGVANPLIIWLHGAGEGGTDVNIALLGGDATNLMEDGIQRYFTTGSVKGAYVLAVQTPTVWMDNGSGTRFYFGQTDNPVSIYTQPLMETIKAYVAENGDIDANRIYLVGCSNGGYMTVNMLLNYGDYFAAALPMCEGYYDSYISDAQIVSLANMNIWFTHASPDTTNRPADCTTPTYNRLLAAGATNVYYSYFESIVGTDMPGQSYNAHWSWVYALQDQCTGVQSTQSGATLSATNDGGGTNSVIVRGKAVTMWGWLATRRKT